MPVRCDQYNNVAVLAVEGDLAAENTESLRREAESKIESLHIADFIVDLERCDFVDSDGLETLLWLKRRCEDLFGQAKLACVSDNIRKILDITRLHQCFEIQPDLAGALKLMG